MAVTSDQAPHSFLLNLLAARSERKDTRVFAHAAAETQVAITDDLYGPRPASRAANVVINTQEPGFLEVFPRVASRPPRLLQELESMLIDRLRAADKSAWPGTQLLPKGRDPILAANLALEVHRQCFAAFAHGFSTYTSLLSRIQAEFEFALAEGVRCAWENVEVRKRLAEEVARQEATAQEVRAKILSEAEVAFRKAAFGKLQETKERTQRLSRRAAAAERELAIVRAEQARLRAVVASLNATQSALSIGEKAESAWAEAESWQTLHTMSVGPLTSETQAFLEQEYVVSTSTGASGMPLQ